MKTKETQAAKKILESVFTDAIAKTSTIYHKDKVIEAVQITTKKSIDSSLVNKLGRELYEEKIILDYRISRSGTGLTIALFDFQQ